MSVEKAAVSDFDPATRSDGERFDLAVQKSQDGAATAWQGEWDRRVVARDEAAAVGNDALAKHFQAELDVMKLAMPAGSTEQSTPPPVAQEPVVAQPPVVEAPVTEQPPVEEVPAVDVPVQAKAVVPPGAADGANSITFTNDNPTESMTITFTNNPDSAAIPPITLKPGETLVQAFPEGWSGNFRSTEGDGVNVTLGEVKFDGGGGQTYYDVSYIEGYNTAMTIEPAEGGRKSGTLQDLAGGAPESIIARDAEGNVYGLRKTTTANVVDQEVVDYYRGKVGADEGYVIPTDDASTLGSGSGALSVHLN